MGSAVGVRLQEEEFFLEVGSKPAEVKDLGQTSTSDLARASEIGLRLKSSGREDAVEVDCQCHQTR